MSTPGVEVVAPSRLHFGMFSFGRSDRRQYGGVGTMVDRPGLRLRITAAGEFAVRGPLAARAQTVAERLAEAWRLDHLPACLIDVEAAPPDHVGLGTGTQLALAVTAGLNAWHGEPPLDAARLAALAGRGDRSAIGTYGFTRGGLLVEAGKLPGEALSPLEHRVELPAAWRFALICPTAERGLSGEAERRAFREMPAVPAETTERLRREVAVELLPAAEAGDFDRFSRSLYRFGREAGSCFAARQGGPFASGPIAELVATMRAAGIEGVGQSSWGPTVFALLRDEDAARQFVETLARQVPPDATITIAPINSAGARVTRLAEA